MFAALSPVALVVVVVLAVVFLVCCLIVTVVGVLDRHWPAWREASAC